MTVNHRSKFHFSCFPPPLLYYPFCNTQLSDIPF